jgi:hypothetical protein
MNDSMEPSLSATASPDESLIVSPELALVDPALAARERTRLPVRGLAPASRQTDVGVLGIVGGRSYATTEDVALAGAHPASGHNGVRRWLSLAGAAAGIATSLMLLDVRVEVGKSPASAESQTSRAATPASQPETRTSSQPAAVEARLPRALARRFAWAPVQGASAYRVEIHSGSTRIFTRVTSKPQVTVPATWVSEGKRVSLEPGEYNWYVWPIESGRRASRAVVQASLSIPGD